MPHPLPEDINAVEGLKWFLVAVPDDPAYTRAAMDVYTELANFWKWGKEGPVPTDSDLAAQHWSNAVYETIEAYQMGFPDILLGHIDEIEALLSGLEVGGGGCCDEEFIFDQIDGDGIIQPTPSPIGEDIVVGEGDPPGGVEDWPAYNVKLCDAATKFAEGLSTWFDALQVISGLTTLGLAGAIAYVYPVLAAVGLIGATIAGLFGVFTSLAFLENLRTLIGQGLPFSDEKDEVNDPAVIQEVICAIVLSTSALSAATAVQAALNTHAPNAAPYVAWLPLKGLMGLIFSMESDAAGGFGGGCGTCEYCFDEYSDLGSNHDGDGFWTLTGGVPDAETCSVFTKTANHLALTFANDVVPCARFATLVATVERYRTESSQHAVLEATYTPTSIINVADSQQSDGTLAIDVPTEVTITVDMDLIPAGHPWAIRLIGETNDFPLQVYETRLYFHD